MVEETLTTASVSAPVRLDETMKPGEAAEGSKESPGSATEEPPAAMAWSELLGSPEIPQFSPSKKFNPKHQQGNSPGHGFGLLLCANRSKELTRTGRKAVLLLLETANLYDAYAQQLLVAASQLDGLTSAAQIQEAVLQWSAGVGKLSKTIRSGVAQPLQGFFVTQADAIQGLLERYTNCRQTCYRIRQKASVQVRNKYKAAIREAEQVVAEWKIETARVSADDKKGVNEVPKRVTSKLQTVQSAEAKYKRLVSWENESVKRCQRLEAMALQSLQKLEEDRLVVFQHSILRTLKAEKESVSGALMRDQQQQEDGEDVSERTDVKDSSERSFDLSIFDKSPKKRNSLTFPSIYTKNSMSSDAAELDDGTGVMDAETLGLPAEIGKLRDEVRSKIAARSSSVQAARQLSASLDCICTAALKFGEGIRKQIRKASESNSSSYESLHTAMASSEESPRTINLWNYLVLTLEQDGKEALAMANKLETLRTEFFDDIVRYGDKTLKSESDKDDASWKQLCDAVRAANKAESRYKQTAAETAKARDRVKSVDSDSGQQQQNPMTVSKQLSQSIASMSSILPNKGELLMKILDPSVKASHAQKNLQEADQKESKNRQMLTSALELTALTLEAYKSNAEALVSKYNKEEGWGDLSSSFETFISSLRSSRLNRLSSLNSMKDSVVGPGAWADVTAFMNDWAVNTQKKVKLQASTSASETSDSEMNFMLPLLLEKAPSVGGAPPMLGSAVMDDDDDLLEEETEMPELQADDGPDTDMDLSRSPVRMSNSDENQAASWMKRTFSLSSDKSDSILGKMTMATKLPRTKKLKRLFEDVDTETGIFCLFWPIDVVDSRTIPAVVQSFACSFRDGSQRLPFQYGRIFVSDVRLSFVSWTGKQLSLKWAEVVGLELMNNSMSSQEDTLKVKCKKGTDTESYMILGGLYAQRETFEVIQKTQKKSLSAPEAKDVDASSSPEKAIVSCGSVAPDETLKKMNIVFSNQLSNTSVQTFYEIVWSEKDKPFYKPWLEKECFDVVMGDWQMEEVNGHWCGERYRQSRDVKFKVKRKTHLYIGPPVANVLQKHYCRVEGNEKCVLAMRIEFEGIPYSDTFAVEVRWVATREGESDLLVQCGVVVDFKKSTFLKSKIQAGTLEETKPVHRNLFRTAKAAILAARGEEVPEVAEEEVAEEMTVANARRFDNYILAAGGALVLLVFLWRIMARGQSQVPYFSEDIALLGQRMDKMEADIQMVQETLDEILALLKNRNAQ